jgi:hypothetical protein
MSAFSSALPGNQRRHYITCFSSVQKFYTFIFLLKTWYASRFRKIINNPPPFFDNLLYFSKTRVHSHAPSIQSYRGTKVVSPDFQPMRVPEEPVCIDLFRQNPVFTSLHLKSPVHVHRLSVNAWMCFIVVFTQMSMSVHFKTILNFWKTSDNLGIFPLYPMLLSRFFYDRRYRKHF